MKSKAELSLQVIVIAVLVLVVLLILIYLSYSHLGVFGDNTRTCSISGGVCTRGTTCPGIMIGTENTQWSDCADPGEVCCAHIPGITDRENEQ